MKRLDRKGFGLIGIMSTIILFQLIAGFFIFSVTNEQKLRVFESECDCGFGGCSVYLASHGAKGLYEVCAPQIESNQELKQAESDAFWSNTIIVIMIIMMDVVLALAGIFIIRGISN